MGGGGGGGGGGEGKEGGRMGKREGGEGRVKNSSWSLSLVKFQPKLVPKMAKCKDICQVLGHYLAVVFQRMFF